jgi:hypothetical protein
MGRMGTIAIGTVLVLAIAVGLGVLIQLDEPVSSMSSGSGVSSVVVDSGEVDDIEEKYTPQTERAWCLYGEVRESGDTGKVAVVEEVKWDSEAEGTKTTVEFDCLDDLPVPEGTEYIGHVHSHPAGSAARPSAQDEALNHVGGVAVMGIYNGDELNFFAGESVASAIEQGSSAERLDYEVR